MATAFNDLRTDYNAARQSRYTPRMPGLPPMGSGADWHYRTESSFLRMIELGRHFARNDMVVAPGLRRLTSNIFGDGFTLDPLTGNDELDNVLFEKWTNWSTDRDLCHTEGRFELGELQRQIFRGWLSDGDHFVLLTDTGALELLEAHRCRTPYSVKPGPGAAVHGVVVDGQRRPLEYWFTREDIEPHRSVSSLDQVRRYPARDLTGERAVLHLLMPDRTSQHRGVSVLMPAAEAAGMHDDLEFAHLVQAQMASCYAIFHEQQFSLDGAIAGDDAQHGAQTTETQGDGSSRTVEEIAPGMEYWGKPGEKLHGFSPNIPNPEFFDHAALILTFVAVNLDLPLQVLLLDPTKTNFSGWRGAVDQARIRFREVQRWWVSEFLRPVYTFCVRRWLAEDPALARLAAGKLPLRHEWKTPGWQYIEPMKDAATDLLRRRGGLTSPRRQMAERGLEHQTITDETIEDNVYAIRKAKEAAAKLNQEFDDEQPVHWREVLSMPAPEGITISLDPAQDEPDKEAAQPPQKGGRDAA